MRTGILRHSILGNAAFAAGLASCLLFLDAEAGNPRLSSAWHCGTIEVDGRDEDWSAGRVYLDDRKTTVGVQNDSQLVFVCLMTADESMIRQIVAMGMTVWFDPDGGDDKVFGVRYPLGARDLGHFPPPAGEHPDSPESITMSDSVAPEMELLDEQGEVVQRLLTGARSDIAAKLMIKDHRLVYELRVPLYFSEENRFAVGTVPGARIGVGFETAGITLDRQPPDGMKRPGGGFGGHGGRGNRPPGDRPGRPEALKLWTQVDLIARPEMDTN